MDTLGTIEPTVGVTSGRSEWIALIDTHPSLAPVPPRQGINPFTKGPYLYKAPRDSARILLKGLEVGSITWAEDESQRLLVWSRGGAQTFVAEIAGEVASTLGWRFVPESAA